jgi:MFS family permease
MLRYSSSPEVIGWLWAAYALAWAGGNAIAHKLSRMTNLLVVLSTLPLVLMSFIDNWFGIVLFLVQAVASAAMLNHIETSIQHNTPSNVRASILSVVSSIGRLVVVPCGLLLGWLILNFNVLWALRLVTVLAVLALVIMLTGRRKQQNTLG